jgi:hypothetical protein
MHELARKLIASTTPPPPPAGPVASPPVMLPEHFEDFPAFRESS